jgi:hypothetical protein
MDIDHFLWRIDAAQERLEQLQQAVDTTSVSQQITELRVEMRVALEEKNRIGHGRCDAILSLIVRTVTPTPNYQSRLSVPLPLDGNVQRIMDLLSYDPFIFNE